MLNILIVDDEDIEREVIKFLVNEFKFELNIAEAVNGEEALRFIENNQVDILCTDIRMPFMDGLELSARARAVNPGMKILIFSAYSEFKYAQKAIEIHVLNYVLKPVEESIFFEAVSKAIQLCNVEKEAARKVSDGRNKLTEYDKRVGSIENGTNRKVIKDVLAFVHENYMKSISVEIIADTIFLSADYLSYLFKEETGHSLMKYITSYRLKKAKELLKDTNYKIIDVCGKVGYSNLSYFCMIFKNNFGISPAKYREKVG